MNASDKDLNDLTEAIASYCDHLLEITKCVSQRRWSGWRQRRKTIAHELRQVFDRILPGVVKVFDPNLPAPIYVEKVISFGVAGLNDRCITLLWEEYLLKGGFTSEDAHQSSYSRGRVYHRLRVFPDRVATQLWEKNRELINPQQAAIPYPQTVQQRRIGILREIFHLTNREAEVLLVYCRSGSHIGRKAIAASLYISINTLKTHHRSICRKVDACTVNEAADKAKRVLRERPEAEWVS